MNNKTGDIPYGYIPTFDIDGDFVVSEYKPQDYNYGNFVIKIDFDDSDINERFIFYNIRHTDVNGYKHYDLLIFDRNTKNLWSDWKCTMAKPPYKNAYACQKALWGIKYYRPLNILQSLLNVFWSSHDINLVFKNWIYKRKNYDNDEFKDFLELVYRRESVERDLF